MEQDPKPKRKFWPLLSLKTALWKISVVPFNGLQEGRSTLKCFSCKCKNTYVYILYRMIYTSHLYKSHRISHSVIFFFFWILDCFLLKCKYPWEVCHMNSFIFDRGRLYQTELFTPKGHNENSRIVLVSQNGQEGPIKWNIFLLNNYSLGWFLSRFST